LSVDREQLGIGPQVTRPAVLAVHALAHAFPAGAVALEMAVLGLDAGSQTDGVRSDRSQQRREQRDADLQRFIDSKPLAG
jgi:hypothetical protein